MSYDSQQLYQDINAIGARRLAAALQGGEELSPFQQEMVIHDAICHEYHTHRMAAREAFQRKSRQALQTEFEYLIAIEKHHTPKIERAPELDFMFASLVKWTEKRNAAMDS